MRQGEEVQHRGEDEDQGDQGPRAQVREHPVQQTGLPPGGCPPAASDGECREEDSYLLLSQVIFRQPSTKPSIGSSATMFPSPCVR